MDYLKKKKLGDMLVEEGVITEEQLTHALKEQKKRNQKLGEMLVDLGYTDELTIADSLKKQLKIDSIQLQGIIINPDIISLVNEQILRKYVMIPFEFHKSNPNVLRVAMADPLDMYAIDDLSIVTNFTIDPVISTPREIAAAIDRYYGNSEVMAVAEKYAMEKILQYKEKDETDNEDISQSPIVILVKSIIEQAIRQRASDIHIEPMEKQIRVRFRVDGILYEVMKYECNLLSAIVARIKIIGGMDISEKRKPQDGRITMIVERQEYDIRVSILPTVFGEKTVMRIALKKGLTKAKKELGLSDEEMEKFNYILNKPHGIILVTGPTGSGKSTTLYTALSELNSENVNIITVEDPVEANIDGINQIQVNNKAELTFAAALRSILRQDPDIIMIGEIRDRETAEIAIRASITGHLVVSTLHTNSAVSTITRLVDMGIEPYLIADAVIGVIAQRLVRKLCPSCRIKREADYAEKVLLEQNPESELTVYDACGCRLCNNTGYYGRTGVYEIMPVTAAMKELISKNSPVDVIKAAALREGMSSLKRSAVRNVLEGVTSIFEMKKITFEDFKQT